MCRGFGADIHYHKLLPPSARRGPHRDVHWPRRPDLRFGGLMRQTRRGHHRPTNIERDPISSRSVPIVYINLDLLSRNKKLTSTAEFFCENLLPWDAASNPAPKLLSQLGQGQAVEARSKQQGVLATGCFRCVVCKLSSVRVYPSRPAAATAMACRTARSSRTHSRAAGLSPSSSANSFCCPP